MTSLRNIWEGISLWWAESDLTIKGVLNCLFAVLASGVLMGYGYYMLMQLVKIGPGIDFIIATIAFLPVSHIGNNLVDYVQESYGGKGIGEATVFGASAGLLVSALWLWLLTLYQFVEAIGVLALVDVY